MTLRHIIKRSLLKAGSLWYRDDSSRVIYYHDLHDGSSHTPMSTPITLFFAHLTVAKAMGYTLTTDIQNPRKELEITFDDGFRGVYENFSFFEEHAIPARLFVVTDFIGTEGYVDAKELNEMVDTGLLAVGSHTKTHRNLDTMTEAEIKKELKVSKDRLEEIIQRPIDTFCFPRGRFDERVLRIAREIGYTRLYSSLPGAYFDHFRPGVVYRSLVQHATASEFADILKGGDRIYYRRFLSMHYRPKGEVR